MLAITRAAAKATKLERRTVKILDRMAKKANANADEFLKDLKEEMPDNFEIKPFEKNIFKRVVVWVKSFIKNYKFIKNSMDESINKYKEHFGEVFTKKREKQVKKIMHRGIFNGIKGIKEELSETIKGLNS